MAIALERPDFGIAQPKARRSHLQMVAEILTACSEASTKTAIVYKCNLNFKLIRKYLELLEGNKLIERIVVGKGSYYKITSRGRRAIEQIKDVSQLVFSSQELLEEPTSVF